MNRIWTQRASFSSYIQWDVVNNEYLTNPSACICDIYTHKKYTFSLYDMNASLCIYTAIIFKTILKSEHTRKRKRCMCAQRVQTVKICMRIKSIKKWRNTLANGFIIAISWEIRWPSNQKFIKLFFLFVFFWRDLLRSDDVITREVYQRWKSYVLWISLAGKQCNIYNN